MSKIQFSIVIAGPGSVGKSAITLQFISQSFIEDYNPTIEECFKKTVMISGEMIFLDIIDTAGQDEYQSLRSHYFSVGDGFLLVFSIENRKSFELLGDFYEQIIRATDNDKIPIILCANKSDIPAEFHEVEEDEIIEFSKVHGMEYMMVSALKYKNIDESFYKLIGKMMEQNTKFKNSIGDDKLKKKQCQIL